MTTGWTESRLKELTTKIGSGATPRGGQNSYKADGISLIRSLNVYDSGFKYKDLAFIDQSQADMLSNVVVQPEDVLLNITGASVARCCIVPETILPARVNQHVSIIRLKPDVLNPRFLYFALISSSYKNKLLNIGEMGGSTRQAITKSQIENFSISYPISSIEQIRIVTLIEDAFAVIDKARENTEKNLKNARELFSSQLNRIFTQRGPDWSEKRLADVAITFGRGKSRHRPRNDQSLYGGDYPFIQTGEIRESNHYVTKFSQTYNEKGLAQSKLWPAGTLCITIAANIAETAILTFDACIPDSVIGLVCDPQEANVEYVDYLLQFFKSNLQAQGKGAAQDNINMGTFERNKFPFPRIIEQEKIAAQLNELVTQIVRLESVYKKKLASLDELKQSLLQKALTGHLTNLAAEKAVANV